jgi:hypothetical protein
MEIDPMLRAIENLAAYHRAHEKFYASAPRQQAVVLQQHARALSALADRWSSVEPADGTVFSPFQGAVDLNDAAAIQLDGVLFMEGEGEPAEITRIKRDLRTVGDDSVVSGDWLASAMAASWKVAGALLEVPGLAGLLGDRHRIIANDWQAAAMSSLAGRILDRAADLLDRVDFTPAALRRELGSASTAAARLHSAAELVGHAADLLSDSAGLVHDNEPRWRRFRERVVALVRELDARDTAQPASPTNPG